MQELIQEIKKVRQRTHERISIQEASNIASDEYWFSLRLQTSGYTYDMSSTEEAVAFLEGYIAYYNTQLR